MEKTHQSAVVLSPPKKDWHAIQAIRKNYDRNFIRWMPHITLLYPFYEKAYFETVVASLAQACQQIEPFELSFSTFKYFQHGRRSFTLWLAPEPCEAVCDLQEALWHLMPDCDETRTHKNGFTPHLSVGQVRSKSDLDEVLPQLQNNWQPLTITAQYVDLIWRNEKPDDIFRIGYRVGLGTGEILAHDDVIDDI